MKALPRYPFFLFFHLLLFRLLGPGHQAVHPIHYVRVTHQCLEVLCQNTGNRNIKKNLFTEVKVVSFSQ